MSSTDQARWFSHSHSGVPSSTHPVEVSGVVPGGVPFTSGAAPCAHPAINPYIESGSYLEDMENYLHHGQPGYYGLNMQYRAAHQRSLTGKP